MPITPSASGAKDGFPGSQDAVNESAQVDQYLGSHASGILYQGAQIVTPTAGNDFTWLTPGNTTDLDQPFTMSGTTLGRVAVPILSSGTGADVLVTLCPDNGSGFPNTSAPIASSLVPASWSANIGAPDGITDAGPAATAQYNTLMFSGGATQVPYAISSSDANGPSTGPSVFTYGGYFITVGGFDFSTDVFLPNVNTAQYIDTGELGLFTPQTPIPAGRFGAAVVANDTYVIVMGGNNGATVESDVWVAEWNPSTGTISSTWSAQTPLPVALTQGTGVVSGNFVYYIGGATQDFGPGQVSTIYRGTLNNGQITSWTVVGAAPGGGTVNGISTIINGFLVVTGGYTSANTVIGNLYYAKIHTDGSLGQWRLGPPVPIPIVTNSTGTNYLATDNALILMQGWVDFALTTPTNAVQILSFSAEGPGVWYESLAFETQPRDLVTAFSNGIGGWDTFIIQDIFPPSSVATTSYFYNTAVPVPMISVPFNVSGLVNGTVYHLLIQTIQGTNPDDFVQIGLQSGQPYTQNALESPRFFNSWSTVQATWSIPVALYNLTATGAVFNAYTDSGARTSLFVNDCDGRLIGLAESTRFLNNPRNSNSLFTSGVTPWTATNCTFVQDNTHVQGSLNSAEITPNGTSAVIQVASELVRVKAGSWYNAAAFVYSTSGTSSWTTAIEWYDSGQNPISVSQIVQSLTAGVFNTTSNNYLAPATAAYGQLVLAENSTPSAANTSWVSFPALTAAFPSALPSVASVDYGYGTGLPSGVTQYT